MRHHDKSDTSVASELLILATGFKITQITSRLKLESLCFIMKNKHPRTWRFNMFLTHNKWSENVSTVMAQNTSYKYLENPIYRMYNPIEITSYN